MQDIVLRAWPANSVKALKAELDLITIIGRQSEGSLIRGFDNLAPTLILTLILGLGLSIVRT